MVSNSVGFMKIVIMIFILFFLSKGVIAKNCKKGQPCGNSCISWSKTCRINQSTLVTSQGKIVNNNIDENIQTYNETKNNTTIEAEFGCMVTWVALVDFHLFNKEQEKVIDDVLYKIETKAKLNNQTIDRRTKNELRVVYNNTFNKTPLTSSELDKLKSDVESFREDFMGSCIIQTEKILAMRNK